MEVWNQADDATIILKTECKKNLEKEQRYNTGWPWIKGIFENFVKIPCYENLVNTDPTPQTMHHFPRHY